MIGILSLIGFKIIDNNNNTGNTFAKITYRNELILMIDLKTYKYEIYNTEYQDLIVVDRASEGIFYVPGLITTDMSELYKKDEFAKNNHIMGIKLQVKDEKIEVVYQESPKNLCQLQPPTNSHLQPIVCLPNELVIDIYTNITADNFIPDSVLE